MAEYSMFWTTGTTGDGAASGYTEAQTTEFFGDMFTPNSATGPHTSQGVAAGVLGELAVTAGSGQVSVAGGRLIGEGYGYKNTASLVVAIPTPAANTRIDRIVVRVQHGTTRTARITRIAGTEGAAAPALTQSAGVTWDVPLAQVTVTTAGAITVVDQRSFCHFATRVSTAMLDDGSVTNTKMADSSITSAKIVDGTIQTADLADSSITSAKIVDGTITTTDLANDAVDDTKVGNRVPQFIRRQGGDANNWAISGSTPYTPGMIRMQAGSSPDFANTSSGSFTITFPVAFSQSPLVFVQPFDQTGGTVATLYSVSATGCTIVYKNKPTTNQQLYAWLAIGPE